MFLFILDVKDSVCGETFKWMKYFENKDYESLAQLYSEDCKVFPPCGDTAVGRKRESKQQCCILIYEKNEGYRLLTDYSIH